MRRNKVLAGLTAICASVLSTGCGSDPSDPRQTVYNDCYGIPHTMVNALITEVDGLKQEGVSKYDSLQLEMTSCLSTAGDSLQAWEMCSSCMGSAVEYVYP
ncbi:hypothetical protein J4402_05055 [Candidatus Pacearchaeota archaeon]|nr:hypothetical protein [Candidatus Pacearchaeota archaeon]